MYWGTPIECLSAIMRMVRDGSLMADDARDGELRLSVLRDGWDEVMPGEACRRTAERILRVHVLRTTDALLLAAALIASDYDPGRLRMVCLDKRLSEAGRKEGFFLACGPTQ
jgi:predicted nucleic acid-binding protein